jgi:hypothetical protein
MLNKSAKSPSAILITKGSVGVSLVELPIMGLLGVSSEEQASKTGILSAARTNGLQAVFKNDLLFFMKLI